MFCRENGISPSGPKMEIADRIETFLRTGEIKKPQRKSSVNKQVETKSELCLDTVITENHRCSQDVRAFFKTVINQFIRDYFADPNNQGKSREEAIESWNKIKKLPGSNKYKPNE